MDFCAILTGKCKDDAMHFGGCFAFTVKAMGLNICDAGEYAVGNKALDGEEVLNITKHLR
jgi:hypothetical protein